jgi:hypothetical protein
MVGLDVDRPRPSHVKRGLVTGSTGPETAFPVYQVIRPPTAGPASEPIRLLIVVESLVESRLAFIQVAECAQCAEVLHECRWSARSGCAAAS